MPRRRATRRPVRRSRRLLQETGAKRKFPTYAPEPIKRMRTAQGAHAKRYAPKSRLAVSSLPQARIGKDAGLIVSNQRVPHPKAGSVQYRQSVFGQVQSEDKIWIGGSSIGQSLTHMKTIAHAILAHYLPKMGDLRVSNEQAPDAEAIFLDFQVKYAKDAPGATSGTDFVAGVAISNGTYNAMAATFAAEIEAQARSGLYPMAIHFTDVATSNSGVVTKLRDTNMGRHKLTVSCKGRFRFQNITPGATGDASSSHNINSVDANPVDGKIYTFKNQAPIFSSTYVSTITDATTLAGIQDLQTVTDPFEMYGNTVVSAAGKGGDAFLHIAAPPLNPSSLWRNVSSTGRAIFPPGGFKTYTTSYLRSESIMRYVQNITQADKRYDAPGQPNHHSSYPPAGDSFMMCLRPTMKSAISSSTETIKVHYDTQYIYSASIQRRKASPLQVVNLIE